MKRLISLVTVAVSVAAAQPALSWDPDREVPDIDWPPPVTWTPEPAPVAPPEGIYLVTETYTGDSVTRVGAVTTYSTDTASEITGSYARVLGSVGTGGSSAYDGAAFNGRAALTDGRAVAGTYYENYVRTDVGFLPVSVVFFQDDSEIARASSAVRPQVAPATPEPARTFAPVIAPGLPPTGTVAPVIDRADPVPVAAARSTVRASALLPDRAIEVLRGRRTVLVFSGADVRGWRFMSGEAVSLGALAGAAGDPFVARWDRIAHPSGTWIMRFFIDYADGTSHELVVRVAVRSPGLVE